MTSLIFAAADGADENFASIDVPAWGWAVLVAAITAMLLFDLLVVHRRPHVISFREAAIESAIWVAIGVSFVVVVATSFGGAAAGEYFAGYLIEKSLSIDNVFVWAVLFSYFAVPSQYQFRVLFWGVFGALVLRAMFIFAGVALIENFDWVLYIFGGFLLYTAFKIGRHAEAEVHPERNIALRIVRKLMPTTNEYHGQALFTKENGRRVATPLFTVLVLVEATDVVFAVDSVPAILAISHEPFIVFASNAFAILGLRSLYFLLAGMAGKFRYLNVGLGVILAFVGTKMLLADVYHFPVWASLVVIALVLTVAIVASLRADARDGGTDAGGELPHPDQPHHSHDPRLSDETTAPADAREPFLDVDREPKL
ncbi:MAG TPA: TerC family protein [Acidimicrobiales bacterium]|nr:TerC family protein [Acidimicrobiales bacterium]